uniref:Uncharacterized protein n=1 Tax=Avena sativa TaxID=4498 RepID=A0ACD5XGC5_AVESA
MNQRTSWRRPLGQAGVLSLSARWMPIWLQWACRGCCANLFEDDCSAVGNSAHVVGGFVSDLHFSVCPYVFVMPRMCRYNFIESAPSSPDPLSSNSGGVDIAPASNQGSHPRHMRQDWRLLIGERDKITNEQKNLKAILDQVKMRFLYPARLEQYILKTIRDRWRQHKSDLKAQNFHENKSIEREQDPEKKYPHRAVLYVHRHKPRSKNNKNINEHVEELKDILEKQPELADTSQGKTAWKGDALNRVLGDDKFGHVHGLGLVPNPNKVFDASTSRRFQNTHFSSLEDIPNEAMLSFRLELEKLGQHARNQDAVTLELKEKIRNMEREQNQRSSDLVPPLQDDPPIVGNNPQRKRVYGTSPSKQLPMVEEPNNLMIKQSGFHDLDLHSSNKPAAQDKNKETLVQNGNARQGEKSIAAWNVSSLLLFGTYYHYDL